MEPPPSQPSEPTAEELARVADLLEQVASDRSLLARLEESERQRLLRVVHQVAMPDRSARRKLRKEYHRERQANLQAQRQADEQRLAETGIRAQFSAPYSVRKLKKPEPPAPFDTPPLALSHSHSTGPTADWPKLDVPRTCYTCKGEYDRVHHFYDALCPACAQLNWTKRNQTADLSGRVAVVTGARVKIGYQAALKLLRAGAHTVVLTRFPRDAARRFLAEADSERWRNRLELHGVDLRHTPAVEALADHLAATLPRLDLLLNNACQTVRRPPGFYAHLMEGERRLGESLPPEARPLLASDEELRRQGMRENEPARAGLAALGGELAGESIAGVVRAAELSQIPLAPGDEQRGEHLFPSGQYDHDEQQIDLRSINSWRLRLADVPTVELLEVQLVNAIAPFILNARLKPLMARVPTRDTHIVNVSAMEGVFYRAYKTDKHPHTNMAKAALNMLTRTSAQDYARDGIHMNSVDTGWITDEDPAEIAQRKQQELGFHPPLDIVDAAARICAPYFDGQITGEHVWGKFLKDYQVANW
ncbi:3-ketoacyl-(acyl-carrier-protein) reductase [Pirellulimonas nuda]|uniref:3-ketoacyl-(Acyl-carrier-protein) reductase n=1 Tax=Pirellulimonas nuda TaxID=2528009 RepID=A0A518DJP0_9BACT|nr:SDR family oxidoreductase [Pirellulimonas nuda]QDU91697.1 3-ketoacyl-(acyl-carrier-protein) reductase [Pirellulimonas nuda]